MTAVRGQQAKSLAGGVLISNDPCDIDECENDRSFQRPLPDSCTGQAETSLFQTYEEGLLNREELVLRKLGVRGWGRWQYFGRFFSGPWGESGQKPLSPRAQEVFLDALKVLSIPSNARSALFLTDEGHLELAWDDAQGHPVQIEFGPYESEVYIESAGVEISFLSADLPSVLKRYFG